MGQVFPSGPLIPAGEKPKILLRLEPGADRDLASRWLDRDYELLVPQESSQESQAFDLAIIDVPNLNRLGGLKTARQAEEPVFLPFLLIASFEEVGRLGRGLLPAVDEIIRLPLQKLVFQTRVENLLKLRRLSMVSQRCSWQLENQVVERTRELSQANDLAYGVLALRTQTEHHRLEEELALKAGLLDLATDAIYVTDFEGNFIYVNEAACRSRGYSREELLGLNLHQLITPKEAQNRPQRLEELLAQGELSFETTGIRKDGVVLPLEVHARMIDLDARKVILSVARDITERKQAEEINGRMEAQLRQVQKMEALGTFAGGIAHEFNNVLGAIKGYVELALMTLETVPGADKVKSKLEAALRGGDRARDLVKQIQAFSRHTEQEARPLEILPIIKEALRMLRASIPATIEIRPNLHPGCGLVVADPVQISQILMNLSSNAYHAMRKDRSGVLEISLERVQVEAGGAATHIDLKAGAYVKLTVGDTGHGMDQQTLGRIFDPFFTTKPVGEGTGLGLSAIHGIVKKLGGAIQATSELGRGSTFQVYLPSHLSPSPLDAPGTGPIPRGTEQILLVDDEASIVQICQDYLQRLGYRVLAWTICSQAWEAFRAHPESFDLVITDLTMPAMTGIDLAEAMLQLRPDIPIILTTGYSETHVMDKAKALGIRLCLMKPLVLRHLGWAVRRALDRKE